MVAVGVQSHVTVGRVRDLPAPEMADVRPSLGVLAEVARCRSYWSKLWTSVD